MKKCLKSLFAVLMIMICLSGCSTKKDENLVVRLAGSTSMEKMVEALMEVFNEKYSNITVTCEYTGSSAGIESLVKGMTDIGNSSRKLKDSELQKGVVENIVALDGIVVIVNPGNPVKDLTTEQLKQVYTGELTNWNQLNGKDEAIVVIGRENGSGTRDAFEELLEVKEQCKYVQELDSTGSVKAKVSTTEGAIGYVSLDVLDKTVYGVALNGVEATQENILKGSYMLQRPFVMATLKSVAEQNSSVRLWFEFLQSDQAKQVIKDAGLIVKE